MSNKRSSSFRDGEIACLLSEFYLRKEYLNIRIGNRHGNSIKGKI